MSDELRAKQKQEIEMQEELEGVKDSLLSEKQNLREVIRDRDKLRKLYDEKDSALQVSEILLFMHKVCRLSLCNWIQIFFNSPLLCIMFHSNLSGGAA